jgi:hypothetical protein
MTRGHKNEGRRLVRRSRGGLRTACTAERRAAVSAHPLFLLDQSETRASREACGLLVQPVTIFKSIIYCHLLLLNGTAARLFPLVYAHERRQMFVCIKREAVRVFLKKRQSSAEPTARSGKQQEFAPVRQRIRQGLARGKATGVTVVSLGATCHRRLLRGNALPRTPRAPVGS